MNTHIKPFARVAAITAIAASAVAIAQGQANATIYNWGAMAISVQTGNASYAIDYASRAEAQAAAVYECAAADCRSVVFFANGCGAVAQAANRAWGWSYGSSRYEAETNALNATLGPDAHIIGWACTTGHQG